MMCRYGLMVVALSAACPTHAQTAPPTTPTWTSSVMAIDSKIDGQKSQPGVTVSLGRLIDKGSVSLSATAMGNRAPGAALQRIEVATLAAARQFEPFMLEAHVAAGRGVFRPHALGLAPEQNMPSERRATGEGLGGSVGSNFSLGENLILSPRIAIDFSTIRINRRTIDGSTGSDEFKTQSSGVTLSGGGTLQMRFGSHHQHGLSIMAMVIRTTNKADFVHRAGQVDLYNVKSEAADTFLNYGANVNVALSPKLGLNLAVSRTAGIMGPQSSFVSAGLQVAF